MKVEIWSDIMCPFCYIGKRNFERALINFSHKDSIKVTWKSFQLNPELKTDPSRTIYEYLAEQKGWTLEQSHKIHSQMSDTANAAGLQYNFDKVIPANSFNAHRLSHLAALYELQDEMEERLFLAYFTEGKNIDDIETLVTLATETGLQEADVRAMLDSDKFTHDVALDAYEASQIGVRGVPFFVFNNKYAVSGAQPSEVFKQALEKSFSEFKSEPKQVQLLDSDSTCSINGNC